MVAHTDTRMAGQRAVAMATGTVTGTEMTSRLGGMGAMSIMAMGTVRTRT